MMRWEIAFREMVGICTLIALDDMRDSLAAMESLRDDAATDAGIESAAPGPGRGVTWLPPDCPRGAITLEWPVGLFHNLATCRRDRLEGEELWARFETMALTMIEQTPLRINASLLLELLRAQGYAVSNNQRSALSRRFKEAHFDKPLFPVRTGDAVEAA